jgi:hypothetical protein
MRIAVFLMMTSGLVAAPRPGDEGSTEFDQAMALVKQLGSPRFAVREAASKKLLEMGMVAMPALDAGAKANDEEIRTRSQALIPPIKAAEWKRRADAYLSDSKGNRDLPLLADWETRMGPADAASRTLFAAMVRTNGEVLEQAAADPKGAPEAVKARCRTLLGEVRIGGDEISAGLGDVAAMFFLHDRLGRLAALAPAEWSSDHPTHLLANPAVADGLRSKGVGPALRKLMIVWAESRPIEDQVCYQCFAIAVRNTPFPEAVPLMTRWARDEKLSTVNIRALAIDALGKIDDPSARATLAELATNATPLAKQMPYRLGDHALATLLVANKKDPATYGLTEEFECRFRSARRAAPVEVVFRTFTNDDTRKRGLEKWKAESASKQGK